MTSRLTQRSLTAVLACWFCCPLLDARSEIVPLVRLHAHNDYEHKRPLFEALEHGFCSIEADIHLVDGQLLVAHSREHVVPGRTLQSLYLEPLRERVKKNGGRVYPGGPECTLLIDVKGQWQTTYPVLRGVLQQYAGILTVFRQGKREPGAILAIITGDRSKEIFAGEAVRFAALDGDLPDLEGTESADVIPWISSSWGRTFHWRGSGPFPEDERLKLKQIVSKAHEFKRRVRFWGTPDQPVFWQVMLDNGVDLINTDDLAGAQQFLLNQSEHGTKQ